MHHFFVERELITDEGILLTDSNYNHAVNVLRLREGERIIISEQAADEINRTRRGGGRICAVGVTVIRALETYVTTSHEVRPTDTWTNKFIFPPYEFSIPDAIVSNFHLPESTMLMSVAAFGGYEKVMNAYQSALDNNYRFGPYGDALLIV